MNQVELNFPKSGARRARTSTAAHGLALLIEVPAVPVGALRSVEPVHEASWPRPTPRRASRPNVRSKRRLRRRGRIAAAGASFVLASMVATGALMGLPGLAREAGRRNAPQALVHWPIRSIERPSTDRLEPPVAVPSVTLNSVEPIAAKSAAEPEPPIGIPGYLLPDDTLEAPAHEGS